MIAGLPVEPVVSAEGTLATSVAILQVQSHGIGTINYCELPLLNGSGKMARDIAKANTPGCSYAHFPLPVLRQCTEPLPPDGVDIRIGNRDYCPRKSASMIWRDGVLEFHVFGWGPVVVRRFLDGGHLVWEYADGTVTRTSIRPARSTFLQYEMSYSGHALAGPTASS